MDKEAKALRKKWRVLTKDYQIYSLEHNRAYYPYRYVVDREEEGYDTKFYKWQREIGKENMPENIDKLKEMAYNNSEEYRLLNHYHFARTTGRIAALASFDLYKNIKAKVETIAIGNIAKNGTKVNAVSLHFVDRLIGTIYGKVKHEGLLIEDFQKILFEGMASAKIKYDGEGKPSQNIKIKSLGIITINPITGELIQCNKLT